MTVPDQPRVVCFSAYCINLRAQAFTRGLRKAGFAVIEPKPHGPPGSILELVLSLLPNCWLALRVHAELAAGFKPHPNVTLPLMICKWRGIPTWIDVDDLDHAYREGPISRLVDWLQRPFPRCFDIVSYHNTKLCDYLTGPMRCLPGRLLRIPQGVNSARFAAKPEPVTLPTAAGRPVAIYAAHLNVASDLEPVLEAWRLVVAQLPKALLIVLGGGPLFSHFQQRARDLGLAEATHFTGEVAHEQVPRWFALASTALLYMSPRLVNQYRCSLKLREYFAAGLKVVCNRVGELDEYAHLTYQTTGDTAAFAAMTQRVLSGHSDGREQAAQRFACDQLDWSQIIAEATRAIAKRANLPVRPPLAEPLPTAAHQRRDI